MTCHNKIVDLGNDPFRSRSWLNQNHCQKLQFYITSAFGLLFGAARIVAQPLSSSFSCPIFLIFENKLIRIGPIALALRQKIK